MIIGLTGTNASGKTSIVEYLKSKGFEYHSLSDVIREELTRRGLEHSRDNLRRVGNELRQTFGAAALAEIVSQNIGAKRVIIDSIRNVAEVARLRELKQFYLIAVDAPLEVRFQRAKSRGRAENADDIQAFADAENKEKSRTATAQNIDQCMKLADFTIHNDGSLVDLHNKVDAILTKVQNDETLVG